MSARDKFEQELARLNAIWAEPEAAGASAELQRALGSRSNLLVARAAEIVGEMGMDSFIPDLKSAFDRFLIDSVRRDPTCAAKFAIADALNRLEVRDADLFVRGAGHVQPEPVWGGREDTAARLRAVCALGIARSDPPDAMLVLAGLLADSEADARSGAARAIAHAIRPGGAALLWYKVLVGDTEMAVLYECFSALLQMEPERALLLVGDQARGDDPARAEAAVLALGGSRLSGALPILVELRDVSTDPAVRRTALTAIAQLGNDDAFAYLLGLLADGPPRDALDALDALSVYRDDERRRRKIERVLRRRDDLPPAKSPYSTT